MIVLTIGSDRSLFTPSKARDRVAAYGRVFDRMEIVVFSPPGFRTVSIAPNVAVHPAASTSRLGRLVEAYRVGKKILHSLEKREDIVISCQDPFESGLVGYFLAKIGPFPLQLQIHTDFLSPYFARENMVNRIRMRIASWLIPKAACIRVVSERIKNSLIRTFNIPEARIVVLPIWSPPAGYHWEPHADYIVLMAARLEPEKGVRDGILAFKRFLDSGGNGRLVIAGDGLLRNSLDMMVRDMELGEAVSFMGWQEDLTPYYREADVFLFTSHYEGWGVAAFDAVRAGIPVVMTDVGLAGEAVKNGVNGIVVKVGDIEGIARALLNVSRDPRWRQPLPKIADDFHTFDEYLSRYRGAMECCVIQPEAEL